MVNTNLFVLPSASNLLLFTASNKNNTVLTYSYYKFSNNYLKLNRQVFTTLY